MDELPFSETGAVNPEPPKEVCPFLRHGYYGGEGGLMPLIRAAPTAPAATKVPQLPGAMVVAMN